MKVLIQKEKDGEAEREGQRWRDGDGKTET
jgi:hypothetical protein